VPVVPTVVALFWLSIFASTLSPQCDDAVSVFLSLFNADPISSLHCKLSARCKFYVLAQVQLLFLLLN